VALLLGGDFLTGLWTAFIGWFLNTAAGESRYGEMVRDNLRGIRVAQLMDPTPPNARPDLTVQEYVLDHVVRRGRRALLVMDGDRLLGIVSVSDLRKLPQARWATTPVSAIMTPAPLTSVSPDAELSAALKLLADNGYNQLPVMQGDQVVGLLSRADILRFLQLRNQLDLEFTDAGKGPPTHPLPERGGAWPRAPRASSNRAEARGAYQSHR
jgi:CBS domain-containing protein